MVYLRYIEISKKPLLKESLQNFPFIVQSKLTQKNCSIKIYLMVSILSECLDFQVGYKITNQYHFYPILWDLLYDDSVYTAYIQGYYSI